MIASSFGHSEVVQQLIDAGANVNARDEVCTVDNTQNFVI